MTSRRNLRMLKGKNWKKTYKCKKGFKFNCHRHTSEITVESPIMPP
jgi:hypothetical protein